GLFGAISGTVTDPSGAVIAGATIKVTNVNTGIVSTYTTNGAGLYNATSLNPGVYNVQAEARGFRPAAANGISLEVNANPRVSLTLTVGESSQVIEVTSEAPILQTQQSDLGQTVTNRQLEQLPTSSGSGRNIYSLIPLAGGVSQQLGCDGCGDNANRPPARQYPYNYYEFGCSVGGPIMKNKLFFFTDYQGIRQHGSRSPQVSNLPNSEFRTGNLRALCTAGFDASGTCLDARGQI